MAGNNNQKKIIIVGGGLVGSLCASFLAKKGFKIDLFESRDDIRTSKIEKGRSINLALSTRGREALRKLDLEEMILKFGVPMKGRMIHDLNGKTKSILYDKRTHQCIYSVERKYLNEILLTAAEKFPNVSLHFNHKLIKANLEDGTATFFRKLLNDQTTITGDLIIGADGAFSTLRRHMLPTTLFDYHQTYIPHGYLELRVDERTLPEYHHLTPNHLHIWPRNRFMMIALPNCDRTWTLTLFMPFEKFETFTPQRVLKFFGDVFPDVVEKIGKEALVEDFFRVKPSGLVSVKCGRYHVGKGLIIGDAAHAMVPFYGQGMNAGFEDVLVLEEVLDGVHDLNAAGFKFTEARNDDALAICDLAMYNYIEMRDLVTKKRFLARKFLDEFLYWLLPDFWIPLYNSVTFTRMGYRKCVENRKWQDKVVKVAFAFIAFVAVAFMVILLLQMF